jgi:hypothetical protein
MNDNEFWLRLWCVVGIVFAAVVALGVSSSVVDSYFVAKMVKAGADPVAARCALSSPTNAQNTCTLYLVLERRHAR